MIRIVADNFVKEDSIELFMETVKKLIDATRQEEGCIAYTLHKDLEDAAHLTFIEEWESEQAIEKHNASPHFTTYVPELAKLCRKEGTCFRYEILDV